MKTRLTKDNFITPLAWDLLNLFLHYILDIQRREGGSWARGPTSKYFICFCTNSDATACNSHAHKSRELILVGLFGKSHNGLVDGIKKAIKWGKCRPKD